MFIISHDIKLFCVILFFKISPWLSNWLISFTNKSLDVVFFGACWRSVENGRDVSFYAFGWNFTLLFWAFELILIIPVPSFKISIIVLEERGRLLLLISMGQIMTHHIGKVCLLFGNFCMLYLLPHSMPRAVDLGQSIGSRAGHAGHCQLGPCCWKWGVLACD